MLREEELTKRQWRRLLTTLTFRDRDDEEIQAFDHDSERGIVTIPRGVMHLLPDGLDVTDLRSRPSQPKFAYMRELDAPGFDGQKAAVKAMFEHGQGRVIAPPGRGKTEIALAFMAAAGTPSLVIVHTQDLFKQWLDRAEVAVPGAKIGQIQGATKRIGHITIAMAQTLRRFTGKKFWRQFGALVIDEAHHGAAETWEDITSLCPAYYRIGITASTRRSDGKHPLVMFNIGPEIYKLKFRSQVPMAVQPVFTKFSSRYNGNQYTKIMRELVRDEARNSLVAKYIRDEIAQGNYCLVLSRQIKHLENISDALGFEAREHSQIVTGRLTRPVRDRLIQEMRDGDLRCILGTQLFEEGVDIPRLNRIFLAFPGTEITALQKIGRGARQFEGKTDALVIDFVDEFVAPLARQWLRRKIWYRHVGLKVLKGIKEGRANGTEKKEGRKLLDQLRPKRSRRA